MTNDLHTLSGAYALDALSAEEAEDFRRHLEQCPACSAEVRELRSAAARMGAAEPLAPPADLRARVLAAADRQPQLAPRVSPIERARRFPVRVAAAVAAAVVLVAGAVGVVVSQHQDDRTAVAPAVSQVFGAADARTATVDTRNGGRLSVATSQRLGRMAVETRGLPDPGDHRVYQLWAMHDGVPTSAGVVDDLDAGEAMAMPASGTTVAITIEPAGGSAEPTSKPIVEMDPTQV